MAERTFLLFINREPVNKELSDYFASFKIDIVHQEKLYPTDKEMGLPIALLIHWSILKTEPHKLNQVYHDYPTPILIINDCPDEEACIFALESGADDFLVTPIYPRELHARINAINRRVIHEKQEIFQEKDAVQFANWRLFPASRQIFDEKNNELQLSAGEYDLLYVFIQKPQCVLDREFLLQITKQSDHNPFDRRIDVQISRLRQKIERDAKKPILIKTIRNGGYILTSPVLICKTEQEPELV